MKCQMLNINYIHRCNGHNTELKNTPEVNNVPLSNSTVSAVEL